MTERLDISKGPLASYVQFFYYSGSHKPSPGKERVLPSGSAQLIINLGGTFFRHFSDKDSQGIKSSAAVNDRGDF